MKRSARIGLVVGGYAVALAVALGAAALHERRADPDWIASSQMFAFIDALYFLLVLSCLALVPTGMALYFLRGSPRFWRPFAAACVALAATGLAAAPLLVLSSQPHGGAAQLWASLSAFSLLRMLGVPVVAAGFVMSTVLAPAGRPRGWILVATLTEALVGTFGILWILARR